MKIQTFSVVVGGTGCNARCPFCVSQMTQKKSIKSHLWEDVNMRRLNVASRLAKRCGCTTAMLTGKGEPTLHPDQLTGYVGYLAYRFPLVELQTNGILTMNAKFRKEKLRHMVDLGLTSICISAVHWMHTKNKEIYSKSYPDLKEFVKTMHRLGLSVRLNITMMRGYVDGIQEVSKLISYAKSCEVEHLTLRPVRSPDVSADKSISSWVDKNEIPSWKLIQLRSWLTTGGKHVMSLPFGANVYDVDGQNVALADCLTGGDTREEMRNLIFYPDGELYHRWDLKGARIL